jgi:NADPH:quinone reductase-like Zn-dependent oxidoreductase
MGAPGILSKLTTFGSLFVSARLRNRRGTFYGITMLYQKDPKPLREDLAQNLRTPRRKEDPLVNRTFPLLAARQAIEFLATGSVAGKIVLLNG